ncbi:MAG TPA: iron-sulfur cluster assembly protein [Bacteroidales bacterium]|nr:iron-sulfur cluster assembly protein [Bacteroidales bacterium]
MESELEKSIRRALSQIFDPEIPINIVDLGLIYGIEIGEKEEKGHPVNVIMTLTAPNCPMAEQVIEEARFTVSHVPGVSRASITLTFDPPWDPSRMSEEAQLDTGLYGMY